MSKNINDIGMHLINAAFLINLKLKLFYLYFMPSGKLGFLQLAFTDYFVLVAT